MPQAVNMKEAPKETIAPGVQGARNEKVMIFPDDGNFRVEPPYKVASRGQTLTFRALGCDKLEILGLDPNAFGAPKHSNPTTVTVTVTGPDGVYEYEAFCEVNRRRKRAKGNSPPGVIIDGMSGGGTG